MRVQFNCLESLVFTWLLCLPCRGSFAFSWSTRLCALCSSRCRVLTEFWSCAEASTWSVRTSSFYSKSNCTRKFCSCTDRPRPWFVTPGPTMTTVRRCRILRQPTRRKRISKPLLVLLLFCSSLKSNLKKSIWNRFV